MRNLLKYAVSEKCRTWKITSQQINCFFQHALLNSSSNPLWSG